MCGQSLPGVDAAVLLVAIVPEYTFREGSVFRQVTCTIGGVTRGACFALSWVGEGAAAVNHIAQSVAVIDAWS